jgi:hypothetical protein
MDFRSAFNGDGAAGPRGQVNVTEITEDCALIIPNPQNPPREGDLPLDLAEVLQKWIFAKPVRVRATLPIVRKGNTIGIFVWWDNGDSPQRKDDNSQANRPESR